MNLLYSCFRSGLLISDTHFAYESCTWGVWNDLLLSDDASFPLADFTAPPAWHWIVLGFYPFNMKFLTLVRLDCVVWPLCPMFSRCHLCSRFPLVCGKQTAGIHDSGWTAGCVLSPPPHPATRCVVFTLPHKNFLSYLCTVCLPLLSGFLFLSFHHLTFQLFPLIIQMHI